MRVVILTGAGVSAESGVPTFRGPSGLWRGFDPSKLATPQAFQENPKLVWEWYDWRRSIIAKAEPNKAHLIIAQMEELFKDFILITQNVDGLHQKAGSRKVVELHGNIWMVRCLSCGDLYEDRRVPLPEIPPHCRRCKGLVRPNVVWFGEALPEDALRTAIDWSQSCDVMVVVGTSGVVYPAAHLPYLAAQRGATVIEVNPEPTPISSLAHITVRKPASEGMVEVLEKLKKMGI
ncbi:Silent information regulator protein Sir2 [Thermocrinis albus DSM 14484]|uniref:NAD-dependent protein deacylase n=1 Tax=Thermocrinis albus (strain DSM 14484 / JCM 11386 / HI 11/12) TaxID=638303 RepID=D3SP03_THEAH|nr:NAD-dependent deacylase [Thermocrinis albus]ADC88890.1 Silent information regulator protein Sir2 [Thermocrinis albus DSM 14484]